MSRVTLADVINRALDSRLADLRVAMPGRIEEYDAARQLATVKPLLRETHVDAEGLEQVESLPVLLEVPVQFPGAGGHALTFPVKVGDPCLLVFADRSLDRWLEQGADVDPVDLRRHALTDAIALLGVRSLKGKLPPTDPDATVLGKSGGARVRVTDAAVQLGASATHPIVKGDTYRSAESTMLGLIKAALTAVAAAIGSTGNVTANGPAAATACTAAATAIQTFESAASSYLSTLAKTE